MFKTHSGYSALWLALLYLAGAYIRKYRLNERIRLRSSLAVYAACVLITWGGKLALSGRAEDVRYGEVLVSYTSPAILLAALMLLLGFSRLSLRGPWKKAVAFFAPAAFGVYLIHEEPLIRDTLMVGRFAGYLQLSPPGMVLSVLGTAFAIWLICSLIDRARLMLFSALKIRQLSDAIERFCAAGMHRISGMLRSR